MAAPDRRDETFAALRKALDDTGSFPGKTALIVAIFDHVEASASDALECLSTRLRAARSQPGGDAQERCLVIHHQSGKGA